MYYYLFKIIFTRTFKQIYQDFNNYVFIILVKSFSTIKRLADGGRQNSHRCETVINFYLSVLLNVFPIYYY